ncbi:autophagy protein Apg9-domain-containing protein, partial [Ochromonadaceae sp. CCMP2298]
MEFQESLLQESHTDSVKHVKNLDKFFKSMYDYYAAKGIGAIILSQFCAVTSLGFTIVFSSFLMAFVDWTALLHCHDEESCHGLNGNLLKDPFHHTPTMASFFVFVYFSLFSGFWVWKCMAAMEIISDALDMSSFYREKLGLRLVDLQHMQWYEVLERLILLHERGAYIVAVKEKLTVHDVVMRIMRKENYLIGMINKNALDLFIPWWIPFASERFLTKSIEWALHFCILDYMFDEQFDVSSEFLNDVAGLQWRFQVVGLIHLLLLPFMLIFMTVHFFLQNAQHFHSSRAYLGPRQWSPLALWKFREFNELPHIFEERINKSYKPANEYISGFHNPYTEIVARCLTYIAGAFVATLLLISVLSDGALLYVHMGDYNLLWYLGIFSALYAGARSLIPDEPQDPESSANLLRKTCAHTHYFPPHWDQQASSVEVKDEMCSLYQYKGQIFLMEILSVVLTPVVLCFSLPACAHTVLDFIRNHSRYIEGVGAVCDFSLFDLERYGDDDYGAEKNGFLAKSHRPNDGKLEKSLLNFQQAHPNFNGGEASRALF